MNKINIKENLVKYVSLAVFALITLTILIFRPPFTDEANAWMVAKSYNLHDVLFYAAKNEGHLFIWYLIQMPFAKHDFLYPYSMYFLNWLFCFAALIVLWNKSPFSTLEKTLITFSWPFLHYWAIMARCYSVGIFLLFLILSLWKDKSKHPILMPLLIILLANTSAMALFCAFALGLIYICRLITDKNMHNHTHKHFISAAIIFLTGAVLILVQTAGAKSINENYGDFIKYLIDFFFNFKTNSVTFIWILNKISAQVALGCIILSLFVFKNNKSSLFYFSLTSLFMVYLFIFIYGGAFWHYIFFYLNFIAALWMFRIKDCELKRSVKILNILFVVLLSLMCIKSLTVRFDHGFDDIFNSNVKRVVKILNEKNLIREDCKYYVIDRWSETQTGILPYFPNVKFYDAFGNARYGYNHYDHFLFNYKKEFNADIMADSFDENKINVLLSDTPKPPYTVLRGEKWYILLYPLYVVENQKFLAVYAMKKIPAPKEE